MRMDVVHALERKRVCRPLPSPRHRCASQDQTNHPSRQKRLLGSVTLILGSDDAVSLVLPCFRVAVRS